MEGMSVQEPQEASKYLTVNAKAVRTKGEEGPAFSSFLICKMGITVSMPTHISPYTPRIFPACWLKVLPYSFPALDVSMPTSALNPFGGKRGIGRNVAY